MAISSKKLLGSKGGGSLAVRPKTNLVPLKKQSSSLAKVGGKQEDPMLVIKTKVIKIEDILKGTLAAEKRAADEKRKAQEQEDRAKQEQDVEKTPKSKEKGIKIPVPGKIKSFWGNIQKFIGTVLFGWLALKLLPLLPKLMPIVKFLASTADLLINVGGKLFDGLVTFVDWGYKAVKGTEEWIGDKFGDDAAKKFSNFAETFTKFLNVALVAAMIGAKAGMFGMGADRGVRRGIINKGKRVANRVRRFFDPKRAEKLARLKKLKEIAKKRKAAEAALRRARMLRKLRPTNLRRVARVVTGKPIRAVSNVIQSPAVQNVAKTTQNLIKNPGQTVQNLRQAGADKLDDVAKNVGKSKWFSNLKGAGKNIWGKLGQAKDFLGKQGKSFINWADDFGKKFMASADEIVKGVMAQGSKWATQIGDVAQMAANPGKLLEKAKGVLSGQLDDILKQNKTIAQLKNLNPKDAAKSIKEILNNAKKSKGLLQVRNALKGAQKMKIGGVDKVIAALMGLLDYTVFKESPINAILRALGGLLGYTAGFAIGAPFGGAPGFITGMAGGFVGEKAAMLVAKLLAKTPLAQIPDPIMNDGRMLVRDPDGQGMNEQLEQDQKAIDGGEEKKKPEMKELKGEDKKRALEKLEYKKKRRDVIRAHGYDSDELKALEAERLEQIGKNTYPKGDASSITPKANNNIDSISSQASYDSNEGSTQFIPLPLVEGGGGTSGSTSSSSGGGGGGGSSEDASDPLLTLYMGK